VGRLTLNAGIRYDYLDYTQRTSLAPRLGCKFSFSQSSAFSFGAGRQYQNPDYYMLMANENNKNLKPKYTDQVILGIDKLFSDDIKASLETYYKKYFDVPIDISSTTTDSVDWSSQKVNAGKGYAKGIEFFLQKKVKDNFWGTISYSYSIAKAFDPRDSTEKTEYNWDFDYRHVFTGIIGWRLEFQHYEWYEKIRKWLKFIGWTGIVPADESEISLKFRYLGGKPYTKLTYRPELRRWLLSENQAINSERFPPYRRLDLHIQHRWFENRFNIISYLEIDNVFNTKNVWDYNYLENGDKETIYQWGRMIVGGVMVEF
jgi:outer membrane receptor protein involved in Fe transport